MNREDRHMQKTPADGGSDEIAAVVQPEGGADVTGDTSEARRQILKAAAVGAPLILTFRASSAWAVSAGCLVEPGNLEIPGAIIRVDENGNPIPAQNPTPEEPYETIFVTQDPFGAASDRVVDATVDTDRLRALVYNQNIGETCVMSILNGTAA